MPFENNSSGNALGYWDILTALRGPDNINDELKDRTTAVIRAVIVGADITYRQFGATTHADIPFQMLERDWKPTKDFATFHFLNHVIRAARALGLIPHDSSPQFIGIGKTANEVLKGTKE